MAMDVRAIFKFCINFASAKHGLRARNLAICPARPAQTVLFRAQYPQKDSAIENVQKTGLLQKLSEGHGCR